MTEPNGRPLLGVVSDAPGVALKSTPEHHSPCTPEVDRPQGSVLPRGVLSATSSGVAETCHAGGHPVTTGYDLPWHAWVSCTQHTQGRLVVGTRGVPSHVQCHSLEWLLTWCHRTPGGTSEMW